MRAPPGMMICADAFGKVVLCLSKAQDLAKGSSCSIRLYSPCRGRRPQPPSASVSAV